MVTFPIIMGSQRAVLGVNAVFMILPVLFVGLRIWNRRRRGITLDASDILIVIALIISLIFTSLGYVMVYHAGIGFWEKDVIAQYGDEPLVLFAKIIVGAEFLWALSITCVKLSILFFYAKIFAVKKFIIAAQIAAGIVVAWCITVCLVDFLICRPFAFNWDSSIKGGTCGNTILGFQLLGTLNLVTDMIVLALPQPYIFGLHLPLSKKVALAFTFLVGICASIFTILRIVALNTTTAENELRVMPTLWLWGELEPAMGILVACAPTLRSLIWRDKSQKGDSYDARTAYTSSTTPQNKFRRQDFGKLDDSEYPLRTVDIKGGQSSYSCNSVEDGEITRTYDVTVEESMVGHGR